MAEREPRAVSKAGRNERRKLLATFVNNLAVASALAAIVQPAIAILREGRAFTAVMA